MALSTNLKKGLAFIYNEEHNRNETHWDVERMQRICSKLGIEEDSIFLGNAVDRNDPIWATKFRECDYVVAFFGSHGYNDGVVDVVEDVNGRAAVAQEMLETLLLDPLCSYKELDKKLKWFITQTCRGKVEFDHDGVEMYPDYHLISYPCQEGIASNRIVQHDDDYMKGSVYLRYLEEALTEGIHAKGLKAILDDVLERRKREGGHEQPTYKTNLAEEFYFLKN